MSEKLEEHIYDARFESIAHRQDATDEAVRSLGNRVDEGFRTLTREMRDMSRPNLPLLLAALTVLGGVFAWAYSTVGGLAQENRQDVERMLVAQGRLEERGQMTGQFITGINDELMARRDEITRNTVEISWLAKNIADVEESSLRRHEQGNKFAERADSLQTQRLDGIAGRLDRIRDANEANQVMEERSLRAERSNALNKQLDRLEDSIRELRGWAKENQGGGR